MKLDRNVNPNGRGKYALVNMRALGPILERKRRSEQDKQAVKAFRLLKKLKIITMGNESPSDQFFVIKYKDRFAPPALRAYQLAVKEHASNLPPGKERDEWAEFSRDLHEQFCNALPVAKKLPS